MLPALGAGDGDFAPQALNAAWSLEPPAPPPGNPDGGVPPAPPAGGAAPFPVGGVPAPGAPPAGAAPPAGRLTPCLRRQATSAARFAPALALAEAEDEVLLPVVLPQALTRAASAITVSGISPFLMVRCLLVNVNSLEFDGRVFDQPLPEPNSELTPDPELVELLLVPLEPLPVVLAPESLIEVALSVPLELLAPWITTESPGRTAFLPTVRLLVILVADESRTLTVFPELSLM